ncbi:MAG: hypothetical protein QXK07_07035 [Desulfurococcaceae archaeon]
MASEDINQMVEEIEQHIEGEVVKVTPRRKPRRLEAEIPKELGALSGDNVVKIMEFLHKKYLSWLREAESTKYVDVVRSIREETVNEINKFYSEIFRSYEERFKKHEEMLEKLTKMIDDLYNRISIVKEGEREKVVVKQSVLDDPRVRALLYIVSEAVSDKLPAIKQYLPVLRALLLPESLAPEENEKKEVRDEGGE